MLCVSIVRDSSSPLVTYCSLCLVGEVGGGIFQSDGRAGLALADQRSLR